MTGPRVTLRQVDPASASDRAFLRSVYGSTRVEELAVLPWSEAEKAVFLDMQFAAQDAGYRQTYPDGRSLVVELDGEPIGRLFLARLPDELRIVDIALLPGYRGRGIGRGLLRSVLAEGATEGRRVTLHVEPWNPALQLYERLGFAPVEMHGIYCFMVGPAPAEVPADARIGADDRAVS